jgi:roadblock/LC7 domain-containing protein
MVETDNEIRKTMANIVDEISAGKMHGTSMAMRNTRFASVDWSPVAENGAACGTLVCIFFSATKSIYSAGSRIFFIDFK